jgi:Fe-S-cluster-containing hydrogenase component 2
MDHVKTWGSSGEPTNMSKTSAKKGEKEAVDIFRLLLEDSKRKEKAKRAEFLESLGIEEFFEEGNIKIDMKTCKGVECKLCIEVCPTNALYWKAGEIGIIKELCIYCTSCVLNCMVDNCIEVERKRSDGETETFSNPQDVAVLLNNINTRNRIKTIKMLFPDEEAYLKRYWKHYSETEKKTSTNPPTN